MRNTVFRAVASDREELTTIPSPAGDGVGGKGVWWSYLPVSRSHEAWPLGSRPGSSVGGGRMGVRFFKGSIEIGWLTLNAPPAT